MTYKTPTELAEQFQVSPETVRRMARTGEWPSSKIGKLFRFDEDDIARIRELIRTPKAERVEADSPQDLISRIA